MSPIDGSGPVLEGARPLVATPSCGDLNLKEIATQAGMDKSAIARRNVSTIEITQTPIDASLEPAVAITERYLTDDLAAVIRSPNDPGGIDLVNLLNEPEVAEGKRNLEWLTALRIDLTQSSTADGERIPVGPELAHEMISEVIMPIVESPPDNRVEAERLAIGALFAILSDQRSPRRGHSR
jgi:hypothetical protein